MIGGGGGGAGGGAPVKVIAGAETVGPGEDGDNRADQPATAQFLGCPGGEGGDAFAHHRATFDRAGERTRDADGLFVRGLAFQVQAGGAAQFQKCPCADDTHALADPGFGAVVEIQGALDRVGIKHLRPAPPDAPDLADRDFVEHPPPGGLVVDTENAVCRWRFLGDVTGDLGQGLGPGDADRYRNAGPAFDGGADILTVSLQPASLKAGQVEECLVDGIKLDIGGKGLKGTHYAGRHVAVQWVVGGIDLNVVTADFAARLEQRFAHGDAERFGLVGAGNDAAVVVGQHDDRAALQVGREDPFTGNEKIVAIDQREDLFHDFRVSRNAVQNR